MKRMWNQLKLTLVSLAATGAMITGAAIAVPTMAEAQTVSTQVTAAHQDLSGASSQVGTSVTNSTSTQTSNSQQDFARSSGYRSGSRSFSGRSSTGSTGSIFGSTSRGSTSTLYGTRTGMGSHLFSFGSGLMLGSLFHPFGGYYGYGGGYGFHGFSVFSFLLDILVLYIIWRIVRRLFFRR